MLVSEDFQISPNSAGDAFSIPFNRFCWQIVQQNVLEIVIQQISPWASIEYKHHVELKDEVF